MKIAATTAALFAAAATAFAASGTSGALVRLLNTRSSGSPKLYAEAAAAVAKDAARGKIVQQYVIALLSREPDAPSAARIDEATRKKYLANSRRKIAEMAEKRNNPLAWYLLSMETNDMEMLRRAATLGNIQGLNAYATIKMTDVLDGVDAENPAETLRECYEMFEKASADGDANALNSLGLCRQNGYGCEKDDKKAFEYFKRAADSGHPEAINNLGRFYREGIVVEKDPSAAAKCFESSAAMGNVWGQLNYATALMNGEGLKKNPARAIDLFRSIAAKGIPEAMEVLSDCYAKGLAGLEENPGLAAEWRIRSLAARGDANAAKWLKSNGVSK